MGSFQIQNRNNQAFGYLCAVLQAAKKGERGLTSEHWYTVADSYDDVNDDRQDDEHESARAVAGGVLRCG